MKTKTLAVALFAAVMTMTIAMQPVFAQTATGTATVEAKTCGLVLEGDTSIDYGALLDGNFGQGTPNLTLNNTGNSPGTLFLSGEDWVNATNNSQTVMNANQTHYNLAPIADLGAYSSSPDLDTVSESFTVINNGPVLPLYFALVVDLIDPLFNGAIVQSMTFTTECV